MYNYSLILNFIITWNCCTYEFHQLKNHNLWLNLLSSGLLPQCHPKGFVFLHGDVLSLTPLFQLNSQETIFFFDCNHCGWIPKSTISRTILPLSQITWTLFFLIALVLGKIHSSEWSHIPSLARPAPEHLKTVEYNYEISRLVQPLANHHHFHYALFCLNYKKWIEVLSQRLPSKTAKIASIFFSFSPSLLL